MQKLIVTMAFTAAFAFAQTATADKIEIDDLKAKQGDLAAKLPAAAKKTVSYKKDIKPLFDKSCLNCHGPKKRPKGKFRIDTRELALKGGSEGVSIVPGKSHKSALINYIAYQVVDFEMPPEGKKDYPKLTKDQVGLVRAWIDQGAKFDN